MANIAAIRSVGASLATYLNHAYRAARFPEGVSKPECTFSTRSIGGLTSEDVAVGDTTVSVVSLLYRCSMNQHLRNLGRSSDPGMRPVPVSVDLHYLFTFWAKSAENEQLALAWMLRQLHDVPVLDSSILTREAAWAADDVIQLIPSEITIEEMMRIWDTLEPHYRLTLPYIARVVRIDADDPETARPVVATRVQLSGPTSSP